MKKLKPRLNIRNASCFAFLGTEEMVVAKAFGRPQARTVKVADGAVAVEIPVRGMLVRGIRYLPVADLVAFVAMGGGVHFYQRDTWGLHARVSNKLGGELQHSIVSSSTGELLVLTWGGLAVIDPQTCSVARQFRLENERLFTPIHFGGLELLPGEKRVAIAWSAWKTNEEELFAISLCEWPSLRETNRFTSSPEQIKVLACTPDGKSLVAVTDSYLLSLDVEDGAVQSSVDLEQVFGRSLFRYNTPAFAAESPLMCLEISKTLALWNWPTGKMVATAPLPDCCYQLAFSPDERDVVAAFDQNVRFYPLAKLCPSED